MTSAARAQGPKDPSSINSHVNGPACPGTSLARSLETEETDWRGRLKSDRSPLNSSGTILDEAEPVRKAT